MQLEWGGPQRRPQRCLNRRLEEVAKAVGGGHCRLQTPLKLALGVRETVAGHRLGALEGGGGGRGPSLPPNASLGEGVGPSPTPPRPKFGRGMGNSSKNNEKCRKQTTPFSFSFDRMSGGLHGNGMALLSGRLAIDVPPLTKIPQKTAVLAPRF